MLYGSLVKLKENSTCWNKRQNWKNQGLGTDEAKGEFSDISLMLTSKKDF